MISPGGVLSRAVLVSVLATGSTAPGAKGAVPRTVAVRLEMVAHDREGAERCTVSREIAIGARETLRSSFGEARPDAERKWKATRSGTRCGGDADREGSAAADSWAAPYLLVETVVTPIKSSHSTIDLMAVVSTRKLSGFSQAGEPIYDESTQHRMFTLESGQDGLVPLLLADAREQEALGIDDVVLHLGARGETAQSAEYSAVSIRSDVAGAEVLLDGGRAGRTSERKTAFLRNVRVGDHEVGIRDSSGREARRMVRVSRGRTVVVGLAVSSRELSSPPNGLVAAGKNDRGFEEYRRKRDGALMVKIPEGEFHMGNLATEGSPLPHDVYVSAFLIDKTPVTWKQFEQFLAATGWPLPPDEPYWGIHDDQPAVFVTWEESRAYCEWVGGRLPNEAEREKAARGTDERKYPWGYEEPTPDLATFRHNWGYAASDPVGSHPTGASPYGMLDAGGNVWEWVEDWWDADYFKVSPKKDPRGPSTGRARVVKGGSWDSRPSVLSASSRNFGYIGYREGDFGFRCAADPQ